MPPPRREEGDELASLHSWVHSITSSAIASSVGGTRCREPSPFQVDHKLGPGRLHNRQVGGFLALEDAADVNAGLALDVGTA